MSSEENVLGKQHIFINISFLPTYVTAFLTSITRQTISRKRNRTNIS